MIDRSGLQQSPPLVFTPIELPDDFRGEVLAEFLARRFRLPAILPPTDIWRPWLAQLVADHTTLPGYSVLKYSKNSEVFRARISGRDNKPLDVVCRFSRSEILGASLVKRSSRAQRNLCRAVRLLNVGIDTAIPLARVERNSASGLSWLVTEFIVDVVDLDEIVLTLLSFLDRGDLRNVKAGLSDALVELFARLYDARLFHRDLKASNILFTHWDGREGPVGTLLVDLDGLRHRRWWIARRRWQPLIRLGASLRNSPALVRTDFVRFLHQYLSRVGIPMADWKAHFRRLAREATAYTQRSQHRKSHKLDGFTGA